MTNLEKTLSNLEKSLEYKCKDNILNHIWTIISKNTSFVGTVNKYSFKIWKYNGLYAFFYPVIIGKIVKNGKNERLLISTKYNIFGKLIMMILLIGYLYAVSTAINYKQAYDGSYYFWHIDGLEILSFSIFPMIMTPIWRYLYNIGKKEDMQQLKSEFIVHSNSTNQDYF